MGSLKGALEAPSEVLGGSRGALGAVLGHPRALLETSKGDIVIDLHTDVAPIADYPPVNYRPYTTGQGLLEKIAEAAPATPFAAAAGAVAGVVAGTVAQVASASHGLPM